MSGSGGKSTVSVFTFHYVSIKSMEQITTGITDLNLHSTMYLLNQYRIPAISRYQQDLHSTMYLLNRRAKKAFLPRYVDLHSTMYLLNLFHYRHTSVFVVIYIPLCIY